MKENTDRKTKITRELKAESTIRETLRIVFTEEDLEKIRNKIEEIWGLKGVKDYKHKISRKYFSRHLRHLEPVEKAETMAKYEKIMNDCFESLGKTELQNLEYPEKKEEFLRLNAEELRKKESKEKKKEVKKRPIFVEELLEEIDYIHYITNNPNYLINNPVLEYKFLTLSKSQVKALESQDPEIIELRNFIKKMIKELTENKKQIVTEYPYLSLKTVEYDRVIYPTVVSLCVWFLRKED